MGKILYSKVLLPRRAADFLTLPDGAPSKVASRASNGWVAVFARVHNRRAGLQPILRCILQRQVRLTADAAGCRGCRRRRRRLGETPAHRWRVMGLLPDHDLRGPARSIVAGQ